MRKKIEIEERNTNFTLMAQGIPLSMFDHETDDNICSELIERILTSYGRMSIGYKDGIYYPFIPNFVGNIMADGLGDTIIGNSLNGEYFEGSREEYPVMWNNRTWTNDIFTIETVGTQLSETGTSILNNIILTRMIDIISCADDQDKSQAESIIQDIKKGNLLSVIVDKLKFANKRNSFDILKLGNPQDIDRVQYLTKYVDDLIRFYLQYMGIPIQSSGKMAQMNDKELSGYSYYSKIYPTQRLSQRKKFYKKFNKIYGTSWGVEFAEPWKELYSNERNDENEEDNRLNGIPDNEQSTIDTGSDNENVPDNVQI